MKRPLHYTALLLILGMVVTMQAQDTTRIQTFTFDDITKRRGWFNFPDGTQDYRKIMMNYKLKCDAATTADGFPCGEWDYTTYTDVFTYENIGTPYFFLANTNPDTIAYVIDPISDNYQHYEYFPVYDQINSEVQHSMYLNEGAVSDFLASSRKNGRAQFILSQSELTAAGVSPGSIFKMGFDISVLGAEVENLKIRMANTLGTSFVTNEFIEVDFQTVFDAASQFLTTGEVDVHFSSPFNWDGSSNIIVDLSYSNTAGADDLQLDGGVLGNNSLVTTTDNQVLNIESNQFVEVPAAAFDDIDEEITISFWAYGDPSTMPFNSYVFEGVDSENRRVLNCHLPWGNGQVYWDAGHEMSGSYDRINTTIDEDLYAGNWTHWAFTKNTTNGEMAYYINGELAHSGTGMIRSMTGVEKFKIGGPAGTDLSGRYDGKIDEFRVWDKALDETTIAEWMSKSINSSHPEIDHLKLYYDFEDESFTTATDLGPDAMDGLLMGIPSYEVQEASSMHFNVALSPERPDISFTQGSYEWHLDSTLVTTEVPRTPVTLIETIPYVDQNVSGMSYTQVDTSLVHLAGFSITYAPDGSILSETAIPADGEYINTYRENRHQIQNYVTPYGIGLDLGAEGFRWQYEVTDYAPVLQGLVEIRSHNTQELLDLEFEFIEGTPPRDIIDFQTLWLGDFSHTSIADDENIQAMNVELDPTASEFRIKHRTTGHWFGGFNNCAEFCPKDFHIDIDGVMQFQWNNWTECADNPVIDQGGTWIYDRAGWCPGAFADTYDHEITPFVNGGETVSIDFGMEPYPNGGGEGNYRTTGILIQYDSKNFETDGEIMDIVSPNNWEYHNRYNPICMDPVITIRNLGASPMTSATIQYNVSGGESETYNWTGSLGFNEQENVTLPISSMDFWEGDGQLLFEVELLTVNGSADDHSANNRMNAPYEEPQVYNAPFLIWLRTNNAPTESEYWLYDMNGNELLNVDPTEPFTNYRDTLDLPNGCYYLRLEDSGEDGLDFFANNDGTGVFRTKYVGGANVVIWNPAFGSFINHWFVVDNPANSLNDSPIFERFVEVYPNPSTDVFTLQLRTETEVEMYLEIYDATANLVRSYDLAEIEGEFLFDIDLSAESDGLYIMKLTAGRQQLTRRLVKQ